MRIGVPKEVYDRDEVIENRVALTPMSALQLQKFGHECIIEHGAGVQAGFSDIDYAAANVKFVNSRVKLYQTADIIIQILPPRQSDLIHLNSGQTLISFFYPAQNADLLQAAAASKANIMAMDMIPRISRAQKMDALSSMANIVGYRAVIEAAHSFGRVFNAQITAAGKIEPAKVLVVGAGVAGLAAIGAANCLGAIVYAFDVRPEVAEQIESMGAEFVYLDFTDQQQDGAQTGGYAAPSSPQFYEKQMQKFRSLAPEMDIVITTALIPGRDAPKLWLHDMVAAMKYGSVVVDVAAEKGGNCEATKANEVIVSDNGVTVVGYTDLAGRMARQSSIFYATNVRHLIHYLTPKNDGMLKHDMEDDIIRAATVAYEGKVTYPPPIITPAIVPQAMQKPPPLSLSQQAKKPWVGMKKAGLQQLALLLVGGAFMAVIGQYAPVAFMQHFMIFVLACFVGFQVIWGVTPALHTPLMAVTNAISGIIILGALLQLSTGGFTITFLASISILVATINIVGGFMVTWRMLRMFQKT